MFQFCYIQAITCITYNSLTAQTMNLIYYRMKCTLIWNQVKVPDRKFHKIKQILSETVRIFWTMMACGWLSDLTKGSKELAGKSTKSRDMEPEILVKLWENHQKVRIWGICAGEDKGLYLIGWNSNFYWNCTAIQHVIRQYVSPSEWSWKQSNKEKSTMKPLV